MQLDVYKRQQDSLGTATNVTGDGAIAIIVDYLINKKSNESKVELEST